MLKLCLWRLSEQDVPHELLFTTELFKFFSFYNNPKSNEKNDIVSLYVKLFSAE